jgi:mono/diheme cytochrome c family protein
VVPSVVPTPSPTPSASVVSFKGDVAPLLTRSCGGCHFPGGPGSGDWIGFDAAGTLQHAGVKGDIDEIVSEVERGRMPFGGRSRLTKAEVDLLKAWRTAGMPAD